MEKQWHPDPEPIETNDQKAVWIGTAAWAIALVALLIFPPAPAQQWWVWTCVAGIVGGLFGVWFVRRFRPR